MAAIAQRACAQHRTSAPLRPVFGSQKLLQAPRRCSYRHSKSAHWMAPARSQRLSIRVAAVKRVPSTEACELLQSGLPYLDVRTQEEFAAGHPAGAINIPFWFKTADGMVPNPDFLQQVQEAFPNTQDTIIVGCRSGNRSAKACAQLEQELCYGNLIDDAGGWLGWVEAQLPTEVPSQTL